MEKRPPDGWRYIGDGQMGGFKDHFLVVFQHKEYGAFWSGTIITEWPNIGPKRFIDASGKQSYNLDAQAEIRLTVPDGWAQLP